MTTKKNVALFIETSSNFGRDLLAGIARYLKTDPSWSSFLEERDLVSKLPNWFSNWQGHGILTRSITRQWCLGNQCGESKPMSKSMSALLI